MTSFSFVLFMVINLQDIAYQYNNAGGGDGWVWEMYFAVRDFDKII